jgi:hypothetical protein
MERVNADMEDVEEVFAGSFASLYIDLTAWRRVVRSASRV